MIDTKELADICGKSLKAITEWAKKNGVKKSGYRWDFTSDDCRKLFEYYKVEVNELPLKLKNELNTENEDKLPLNESNEESNEDNYEDFSTIGEVYEANERLVEAYKEQIETLKEEVQTLRNLTTEQSKQISALIDTNKALSASNAVQIASDKKEILLGGNDAQEVKKKSFWQRVFGD